MSEYEQLLLAGDYAELEKIENHLLANQKPDWSETREISYFVKALTSQGLETTEQFIARRVLIDLWNKQSPSNLSKLLKLKFEYNYAWHLRGEDYAYNTLDESLEGYRDHLAEVSQLAEELRPILEYHPEFWNVYLDLGVSLSWSWDEFEEAYRAAVAIQPDYFLFHASRAFYYLPRWHGTPSRYSEVLDEMERDYYQYYGDRMYALLQHATRRGGMYENGEVDWDRFRKSFEAVIAKSPEREPRVKFAIEACLAEEWTDLKVLLGEIDPAPNGDEWSSDYFRFCSLYAERFDGSRTIAQILDSTPEILVPLDPLPEHPIAHPESDRKLLESVSTKDTQYLRVADAVMELASRNPNVFFLMDEIGIRLTLQDTYKATVEIANHDAEAAIGIVHRLSNSEYAKRARELLKRSLRFSVEPYPSMLAKYPILWELGDIAQLELPPEEIFALLAEKERFSNYHSLLQREAVGAFYLQNPELVLEYLEQQPPSSKYQLTSSVRRMLLEIDYSAAVNFDLLLDPSGDAVKLSLEQIVNFGDDPIVVIDEMDIELQEKQLYPVLRSLAFEDPKLASKYLSRIPKSREKLRRRVSDYYEKRYKNEYDVWLQRNSEWMVDAQFRIMIMEDVFEAIEFANGIENEEIKERFLEIAGNPGPRGPVDEALASMELPDSRFDKDKIKTLNYVIERDPATALDWFEQNVHSISPNTLSIVVSQIYYLIELDVFTWLQKMPDYESLQADRVTVFKFYSINAPNVVADWIADNDVVGVEKKYYLLAKRWLSNDEDAALVWIDSVADSLNDEHLAEVAQALIDSKENEKARGIIEKIGVSELKESLFKELGEE